MAIIPTRRVKKALALPLSSELTAMVVKTWKPGIAPPIVPSEAVDHRLDHLVQLESSSSPATNAVAATLVYRCAISRSEGRW